MARKLTTTLCGVSVIIGALVSSPALAHNVPCNTREHVKQYLSGDRWREAVAEAGVTNGGGLMELWVSENTWTLVVSGPDGQSCIIAAGEGWRDVEPKARGPRT